MHVFLPVGFLGRSTHRPKWGGLAPNRPQQELCNNIIMICFLHAAGMQVSKEIEEY